MGIVSRAAAKYLAASGGGSKVSPAASAQETVEKRTETAKSGRVNAAAQKYLAEASEEKREPTTAEFLLSHPSPAQGRELLGVRGPVSLPVRKAEPVSLPTPKGRDEKETLRQESRLRTQLAKGVSAEELRAQREQRLQNISAAELKKRQEQAVGHLEEARKALAERERETVPYAARGGTAPAGGLPYAAGTSVGERSAEDKAIYGELDKWQGIVNDLSSRYYYRENEEQAAALAGDRAGQSRVQAVEDILADLRVLGEVATGQYGDQRDREALMAKYGLSERELEG